MEADQAIKLTERILNFLSKLKCKIMCCCRSSCTMDGSEPETPINEITQLETIAEL